MITSKIKKLFNKLNTHTVSQIESATGFAMAKGHYEVGLEHFFAKCIEDGRGDIPYILNQFNLETDVVKKELLNMINGYQTGNTGNITFSLNLMDLIEKSWIITSIDFSQDSIRSAFLFLALISDIDQLKYSPLNDSLSKINKESLIAYLSKGIKESLEEKSSSGQIDSSSEIKPEVFDQYTINLTEKAKAGKIDPIFGRDEEINLLIDILSKRIKNNPILLGEPGTGKTAIVEGLALKIASGDVPEHLKQTEIHAIDMGLLQAGAGVKGEFEKRLKSLIQAVKDYPKPIKLFIDEVHTLIGAGNNAGTSDAANLMKPELSRGDVSVIAATTWAEYKKFILKDKALNRRFHEIKVAEPDNTGAYAILRGLKHVYSDHHGIRITEEAVKAAVDLSRRYITDRLLPDKAIDIMDAAAVKVARSQNCLPQEIDKKKQCIDILKNEKNSISNDAPTTDHSFDLQKKLLKIDNDIKQLQTDYQNLCDQWNKEKEYVENYLDAINQLETNFEQSSDQVRSALNSDVKKAKEVLKKCQGHHPLVYPEMDREVIAQVISEWTGISIDRILEKKTDIYSRLQKDLSIHIVGQTHALKTISDTLLLSNTGFNDQDKPMGIFLAVGPGGTGKTETASALSEVLFGSKQQLIRLNMSEYQEKHHISKLTGSSPGLVGYGEGGFLTNAIRKSPYSIILLDNIEKAHPQVLNIFTEIFENGYLSDGEGEVINFCNTVFILTTSCASHTIIESLKDESELSSDLIEEIQEKIEQELGQFFYDNVLSRVKVIPYFPLQQDDIKQIVKNKVALYGKRIQKNGIELKASPSLYDWFTSKCNLEINNARNVETLINKHLSPIFLELMSLKTENQSFHGKKLSLFIESDKPGYEIT